MSLRAEGRSLRSRDQRATASRTPREGYKQQGAQDARHSNDTGDAYNQPAAPIAALRSLLDTPRSALWCPALSGERLCLGERRRCHRVLSSGWEWVWQWGWRRIEEQLIAPVLLRQGASRFLPRLLQSMVRAACSKSRCRGRVREWRKSLRGG